ncbi:MAG: FIST N-terminal domain-containing protein [Cyanobacteria bacterium P01_F01_bin.4]
MKWANGISTRPSLEFAIREVTEQALAQLQMPPDLGIVYISSAFASEYPRLLPLLREQLPTAHLVGCSGGGVVGMTAAGSPLEVEGKAAIGLTLAHLPEVDIRCFHLSIDELPDLDSPAREWIDIVGISPAEQPHFILMADPFSEGMNDLLQGFDFAYPESVKVGGLAGIESLSRGSSLFCGQDIYPEGVVGVALSGHIEMDAIVAQGCRPIGQPYRVVEGERNIVLQVQAQTADVDSVDEPQTPLAVLQDIFKDLSDVDRELAQRALFIGVAQSSFKSTLEQGDFLIRNLVGVDPKVGAIAIADRVRPGQRIQFHLRDARTSADDLENLLSHYQKADRSAVGALMFVCNGRGEGLYKEPNFDSMLFQKYLGPLPLGGFFCNGEIGPVGNTTFLHGFTSVFWIFREPE